MDPTDPVDPSDPGAMPPWQIPIWGALRNGQKIEAIKLYRTHTGCDLRTAKDRVEEFQKTGHLPDTSVERPPWHEQVREALEALDKLEAIKIYRAHTGCDLRTAKAQVEVFQATGAFSADSAENPTPGSSLRMGTTDLIWQDIRAGKKIDAIKRYRLTRNVGLKAAKDAVEVAEETGILPGFDQQAEFWMIAVLGALKQDDFPGAVRLYRSNVDVDPQLATERIQRLKWSLLPDQLAPVVRPALPPPTPKEPDNVVSSVPLLSNPPRPFRPEVEPPPEAKTDQKRPWWKFWG